MFRADKGARICLMPPHAELPAPIISKQDRDRHHHWLREVTSIPTIAGFEHRVLRWVRSWLSKAQDSSTPRANDGHWAVTEDTAGNLFIRWAASDRSPTEPPQSLLVLAAHLDHPAFVVRRVVAPSILELEFRGGVLAPYFENARVAIHLRDQGHLVGVITQRVGKSEQGGFETFLCELNTNAGQDARPGDIATWDLPPAEIIDGQLHAPACDDLSAVAACLCVLDVLGSMGVKGESARRSTAVLLTRAEEIGFIGAIAACKEGSIPANSRILMIENSRSFDDSPIGGGPIVRVGDRLSVFSSTLTAAVCKRAEDLVASKGWSDGSGKSAERWKWQRKLMPGGACEASVYQSFGFDATCLCLALGNYHNMANLADVQAGKDPSLARIESEINSLADFDGLVDLLAACAIDLPTTSPVAKLCDDLWKQRSFVLDSGRV